MANCFICNGFIFNKDKHVLKGKQFHKNCWIRLNPKQKKEIENNNK